MARTKDILFLICVLLSLGSAFQFVGGRLDHLETGIVRLVQAGQFSHTFDRSNIFSASEDVFFGTSLLGYEAEYAGDATPANELHTHIEVTNLALNALRTTILITLDTTALTGNPSDVSLVQMGYMVLGTDFSGITNGPDSSYVFVQTSSMFSTPDGTAQLFSF